ncbi:MAG: glycosyltransferase family 2 protein [Flavobacteriaceae bacterium]|nr:glycosyltransferase family 2 protein [Flavobacteriaceae bacterium]
MLMIESPLSVIISTYNQPVWLEKCLTGYEHQEFTDFEIIIADDGSGEETLNVIRSFQDNSKLDIKHVWQEDDGFRKTIILNKAIMAANSPYLIFTDGDCIPRNDFVATHMELRQKNRALSGGYYNLTKSVSDEINRELIATNRCFDSKWLLSKGQPNNFKLHKLTRSKTKAQFLNAITTTKASFNGMNVSCWKDDLLAVNGFNELMEYGGEDREAGERMMNNGIKFKQIRYRAICLHLFHERPYVNEKALRINSEIRKTTMHNKSVWTKNGIKKESDSV